MHPRGGKLGFVTVSLENGQGEKYFIPARETVTYSCGSWGVPPRARRPSFFLGGRFPIFFAFSGSSPFSQNRGENRFERNAPAFSRGRLTCGGLHFFFFFRHFMCTLPSKFILHIWRISRWLKGISDLRPRRDRQTDRGNSYRICGRDLTKPVPAGGGAPDWGLGAQSDREGAAPVTPGLRGSCR